MIEKSLGGEIWSSLAIIIDRELVHDLLSPSTNGGNNIRLSVEK